MQCAGPRCHHQFRTMPQPRSATSTHAHDLGMQRAMQSLLGELPGSAPQQQVARQLASLPMRMGGLGRRSASRQRAPVFWASWGRCITILKDMPKTSSGCSQQKQSLGVMVPRTDSSHNASKTAILFDTRFLRLIVIIVAIHSRSDQRFCIRMPCSCRMHVTCRAGRIQVHPNPFSSQT